MTNTIPNPPPSTPLSSALAIAAHGWAIILAHAPVIDPDGDTGCTCGAPDCKSPGKHPIDRMWPARTTADPSEIQRRFTAHPWANGGIPTGKHNRIVVIDFDPRHGGAVTLAAWEAEHGVPATVAVDTGGGGKHLFFDHPGEVEIKNRVGIAPGVDVRGDRGYVVAPGSRHHSGGVYRWQPGRAPWEIALAPLPAWLLGLVVGATRAPGGGGASGGPIAEGARNATLTSLAGTMRRRGMGEEAIVAALKAENTARCEPPLDDAEVERIAQSISRYAPAAPREPAAWDEPIPIDPPELPRFPVHVLPAWMRTWAEATSVAMQCPIDVPALLALAVVALAASKTFDVIVRPGWREHLCLYVAVVLPPGEGKSPVFRAATAPLYAFERQRGTELESAIDEAKRKLEHANARAKAERTRAAKSMSSGAREIALAFADQIEREANCINVPVQPRWLSDDVTPESLSDLLAEQGGRMGVFSSESNPFEVMAGRYSKTPNFTLFLKAHDGDPLVVDRVQRAAIKLEAPVLTLAMTIQPAVIAGFASERTFRGMGLLARFLYAIPRSWIGSRDPAPPPVPAAVTEAYEVAVTTLLKTAASPPGKRQEIETLSFDLANTAYAALVELKRDVEVRLRPDGDLRQIPDWANKLVGTTARVAALLHLADHAAGSDGHGSPTVPEGTAHRAIEIARWGTAHALAAYIAMGASPEIEAARHVLAWIQRKGLREVTQRDVHHGNQAWFHKAKEVAAVLALLTEHGYLREVCPPDGQIGRPSSKFEVNPAIFGTEPTEGDRAHGSVPSVRGLEQTVAGDDASRKEGA